MCYHINSNKCPGRLDLGEHLALIVSIFIAKINPMMDDLDHFQVNMYTILISHIKLGIYVHVSGWMVNLRFTCTKTS